MSDTEAPKIVFPCDYPIKVMGDTSNSFEDFVVGVIKKHDPLFSKDRLKTRSSKKGNYLAVTVTITATGEDQLKAIFAELKANRAVKMVL